MPLSTQDVKEKRLKAAQDRVDAALGSRASLNEVTYVSEEGE